MSEEISKEELEKRVNELKRIINKNQHENEKKFFGKRKTITRAEFIAEISKNSPRGNDKDFEENLYMIVEKENDNKITYKWYSGKTDKLIASQTVDKNYTSPLCIIDEKYNDLKDLFREHQELDNRNNLSLGLLEGKYDEIRQKAKELGIDEDKLKVVINTPEEEKEEIMKSVLDKKVEDNEKNDLENEPDKNVEISKNNVMQLNSIQKIKLGTLVDDKRTLEDVLKLNEDESINQKGKSKFKEIAVVDTNDLRKQGGKTQGNQRRFSFVAIREDGTAVEIDNKLKLNLSLEDGENTLINEDSSVITNNKADKLGVSRFEIIGTNNTISVSYNENPGARPEVYFGQKAPNGIDTVETRLETEEIYPIPKEIRETQSTTRGERNIENMSKEAKIHEGKDCKDNLKEEDVDGDPSTHSHFHLSKEDLNKNVEEIIKNNPSIEEVFTFNEVKEKIAERLEDKEKYKKYENIDELIEDVTNEMLEDASHFKTINR